MLLVERVRVGRVRVHAEAFLHLVNDNESDNISAYRAKS
jgi:hypothetical protein